MAVNVGTVEVLLELRDLLKQQAAQTATVLSRLEKAATQTTTATDKLGKSHDRSASSIDKFGRQIKTTLVHVFAAGAAYKLLGAAVDSVSKQVEFVRTFEKIENITGTTRAEVERLRGSINELSTATGKGPQELAEGFYFIASAGLKGAEATEVLTQAARASAVGLGEVDTISRSITSALNAYGKENLSAATAANQLFVTIREGGAEASEVAGVFGRIVGIASEMGVSFAEVGASIATFTRLGVGADEAVTALRGTLSTLLKPDKQTREAIDGLAGAFGRASMTAADLRQEIKERGLADVLITLNKATGGNVEVMGRLIPNVRALAGVLGNTGQQADAYREILQKMTSDSTALSTAFTDVSKSASFRWDALKAQFEQLSLTLGEHLLPGVEAFGKALAAIDKNELAQLGENAAVAMSGLAEILKIVVSNLDLLQALVVGIVGIKLVSALQAWVLGLGAVSTAAAAATGSTTALAASIGTIGGVVAVAVAALLFLSNKAKEYVRAAQSEIERMVRESEQAGIRLQKLRDARATGIFKGTTIDADSARAEYEAATKSAEGYYNQIKTKEAEIADLEKRRQALSADWAIAAVDAKVRAAEKEIVGFQRLANEQEGVKRISSELLETYRKQSTQAEILADNYKGEVAPAIAQSAGAADKFSQRLGEVTERLKDQLELAQDNLKVAQAESRQRISGLAGELAMLQAKIAITKESRIQLAIDNEIHRLENAKHQLTDQQLVKLREDVRLRIEAEDATKLLNAETRLQVKIWDDAANSAKRLIAEVNQIADNLSDEMVGAVLDLSDSEDILAAMTTSGRQAAREAQLYAQYLDLGVVNARELAAFMADIEVRQEKVNYLIQKMGELAKPAWQIYYDAAFSVIDSIGNALSDAIVEAGMTGKVEWENIWESLKQTLLQIFADMLAEMLKRWIATQLAMAAVSQSLGTGSSGGKTGTKDLASALGKEGATAASSGQMAGTNWSAVAGYALVAYALFVVYKGFIEDHKRKFAGVTLGDQGQIISSAQHGKKYMDGLLDTVETLVTSLKGWLKEFDIQMKSFASITLEADKSGFSVKSGATWIGHFKTAEEAISAAQAFMVKFGEFADSVPELVRAAVRSSDMNMESITSNVAFARQLLTQNMEDIGLAIHDSTELFLEQMRRSFELFGQAGRNFNPQALMEATGSAILYFTNSLQELYNQLTGHKEDPRQAAERQRQAYNLQRAIMIAQITLLLEEVRARVAVVQSQIAMLNALRNTPGFEGGGGGPGSGGGLGQGGFGGQTPPITYRSAYWFGSPNLKGGGAFIQDERNPTNNPQLAALLAVLDNLARALAGLPPEIGEGGVKPGRRGGGRGAREGVRDFINEQRFQLAQAGRSPLQQEIESIRRSFAEQLEAAGKNVKLRQELLALEQQSIEAARKRFQEDVEARFKEITGQTNSFTELRKRFADMRRDINEAGFAAGRAAVMLAELAAAEREAVEVLSQQMAGDLLSGLAQYIEDEKVRAEFLKQAAFIKFNLDMANYKAQFEILKALGSLAPEVLDGIQKAFDWIEDHPPTFPSTGGGGGTGGDTATPPPFDGTFVGERTVWDGWVWTWNGTNWIQGNQHIPPQGGGSPGGGTGSTTGDSIRRAQELLQRYRDEGMNRWQRALTELNRDFEEIRHWLGNTPEVALAYADALHRLREEFLEGLRDYYNELRNFGASQSVAQQFAAAQARYQQLLGMVQGGDLSQAGALQTAAQQLEQLAQQMFGTATGGYQDIRSRILADLEAILGIVSPTGNNVIGGPEWFASGNAASIAATTHVADVVSLSGASRDAWLQRIDEKLGRLVGEPTEPIDPDEAPFSYGDSPRWGSGRK